MVVILTYTLEISFIISELIPSDITSIFLLLGFNIMCEDDDPQTTNCTNILNITYANYGRASSEVCPHRKMSNTNCYEPNSRAIVMDMCELGGQCTFTPANGVFGDPCRGTYKYLEIRYECGNNG